MKIFLKINQIKQLLSISRRVPRDCAMFHLAISTGFRISDILSLKRADMVGANGDIIKVLRLKTIKTKRWMDKPLRSDCRRAVEDYLNKRNDDNPYMFPPTQVKSRFGINSCRPMCRMTAHRIFKSYLSRIIDPDMLVGAATHTIRRSMGKIISDESGRIEPASEYLGHTNIVSTRTYIDPDGHRERAETIVTEIELELEIEL